MSRDARWARWAEIESVLDQVLERPPAERAVLLDRICAGDEELRTAVDRLLAATEIDSPMLDSPAAEQVTSLAAILRHHLPKPGSRLGGYEVIRELGRGGMATVFLARDHKHERDVALKVLHAELAAMVGVERFLHEIRVTARLGHPHIITLIESGETDGFLWYVIPSIAGASLRERLDRVKRLEIAEALAIARQIGSALDYAHRQGVIHRDIKPENILLHEGEAMLVDFGIALAVQEASGSQSGVPIGTPQYMSPEQAQGHAVDARSDVFSFGAVVYEMLSGAAPHAAATSREVIERILKDPPQPLRTTRKEVPAHVEAAVSRALAKKPDERFARPGDLVRALDASPPSHRVRRQAAGAVALIGSAAVAAALLAPGTRRPVVRDRAQLTISGEALAPAISADGEVLAYVVRQCVSARCGFVLETQAVSGGPITRVLDGWSAVYRISWSSNREYLIVDGTIGGRFGAHLVSISGARPPRLLVGGPRMRATFVPGTDSILLTRPAREAGILWLQLVSFDGGIGDSIRISVAGYGFLAARMLADRRWIVLGGDASGLARWRIFDRGGRQRDEFTTGSGYVTWLSDRVTRDALWLLLAGSPALERRLVRLAIDTRDGTFGGAQDTVLLLKEQPFDVSDDGKTIVYEDGTYRYDAWGVRLDDALRGDFPSSSHLMNSTSILGAQISPDGKHVLLVGPRNAAYLAPFEGGEKRLLDSSSVVPQIGWMPDTSLLWYAEQTARGITAMIADPFSGTRRQVLSIDGSAIRKVTPISGGGWAWLTPGVLHFQVPGVARPHQIKWPVGVRLVLNIMNGGKAGSVLMTGWNVAGDSVLLHEISMPDGRVTRLAAFFGEWENVTALADGSILVAVQEVIGIATMYRVRGPGLVERIGMIPRPVGERGGITASRDGRRLGIMTEQYSGDIWLARVSLTR